MIAEMTHHLVVVGVLFSFLSAGMLLVTYGTTVRNRWGVNTGDVFCPRCKVALPRFRQPRSLRQELWGGWTCPACGAEVDKWGRELSSGPGHPPSGDNLYLFKGRSPAFWVVLFLGILLWGLYDYYEPRSILLDSLFVIVFLIWWRKSRHRSSSA
jgi:hypothetical protein